MRRNPYQDVYTPTQEELDAARKAEKAPGEATAWGQGIGSLAGAGLGALLSIPTGGAALPAFVPLGASLGGALGGAIGGSVGNAQADEAEKILQAGEQKRQGALSALPMRQAALASLLGAR